jgi:hypothetical protein
MENLQKYEEELIEALQEESPLSEDTRKDLKYYQQSLGLRDEDIQPIEARNLPSEPEPSAPPLTEETPGVTTIIEDIGSTSEEEVNPDPEPPPEPWSFGKWAWFLGGAVVLVFILAVASSPSTIPEQLSVNAFDYYNLGHKHSASGNKNSAMADFREAANLFQQQGNTEYYNHSMNRIKELQP